MTEAATRLPRKTRASRRRWLAQLSTPSPRKLQALALIAVVPLVAMALVLASGSTHLRWPEVTGLYQGYLIAAPVLVGVVWWRRRPDSRFGPLLVVLGLITSPAAWGNTSSPAWHTLGALAEAPFIALNFYICLAYPVGRLSTTLERFVIWTWSLVLAVTYAVAVLFRPTVSPSGALMQCVGACPANPFQVAEAPDLATAANRVLLGTALAVATAIFVVYLARLRTASRPRRRALIAVAASSLLLLPAFFTFHLARGVLEVDPLLVDDLGWLLIAARVIFPLGFLLALVQADVFAAKALRGLLAELSSHPSHARWRDAIAGALDDRALRIAYRDDSGRFVDADGTVLDPEAPAEGQIWVPVERDRTTIAALAIDPALAYDPELVGSATTATLVAIEGDRLEGELRASLRRLVDIGDHERRRIERDLHDSAQQRLFALRTRLDLAGETLAHDPAEQEILDELGREVDAVIQDLRELARGVYPPTLAAHGPGAAIESVIRRSGLRATVRVGVLPRLPEPVERTIYFCCLEALQNVAKHAGPDAAATVRMHLDGRWVEFAVEDDGVGFPPGEVVRGAGLDNLADRVSSHGGALRVDSEPGGGARITGRIELP